MLRLHKHKISSAGRSLHELEQKMEQTLAKLPNHISSDYVWSNGGDIYMRI